MNQDQMKLLFLTEDFEEEIKFIEKRKVLINNLKTHALNRFKSISSFKMVANSMHEHISITLSNGHSLHLEIRSILSMRNKHENNFKLLIFPDQSKTAKMLICRCEDDEIQFNENNQNGNNSINGSVEKPAIPDSLKLDLNETKSFQQVIGSLLILEQEIF